MPCRLETVGGPRRTPRVPIKGPDGNLLPLPRSLRVCTMSADFWGLPTAGGTATAYGLLTSALSEDPSLDVSNFLVDSCVFLCQTPDFTPFCLFLERAINGWQFWGWVWCVGALRCPSTAKGNSIAGVCSPAYLNSPVSFGYQI